VVQFNPDPSASVKGHNKITKALLALLALLAVRHCSTAQEANLGDDSATVIHSQPPTKIYKPITALLSPALKGGTTHSGYCNASTSQQAQNQTQQQPWFPSSNLAVQHM
jgi:hypothetical protein